MLKPIPMGRHDIHVRIPSLGTDMIVPSDEYYGQLRELSTKLLLGREGFLTSVYTIENEATRRQEIDMLCELTNQIARSHILSLIGGFAEDQVNGVTLEQIVPEPSPTDEPIVRATTLTPPDKGYRQD